MTTPEYLQGVVAVYEEDRYDGTLTGHAWYQDKYCYFHINDIDTDDWVYDVWELEGQNLINALASRQAFIDIVHKRRTSDSRQFWKSYMYPYNQYEGKYLGLVKASDIDWQTCS